MAHLTARGAYGDLARRYNRYPQGAPPTELFFRILRMLFTEREAAAVSLLPIKPFTARAAARIWKTTEAEAMKTLDALADRGLLLDVETRSGRRLFSVPPPMAGFFEFSLMRVRTDIDQKLLSELYYQYVTVEPDFLTALFSPGETQLGRVYVHEPVLGPDISLHVLDYERASEVIRAARHRAVGVCYCRHKASHAAHACDSPLDICLTFGGTAQSLAKHGIARSVDVEEGLDLLRRSYEHDLVQFGENVRRQPSFICNCCGCCCEAMLAAKRLAFLHPVHTTNYLPRLDESLCTGCGKCVLACPVEAMGLVAAGDRQRKTHKKARLDERICLGCGICVRNCGEKALALAARKERVVTPADSAERIVLMAVERGRLQDLIFDNRALWNHRAMAAILGAVLRLPPLKQALASRQLRSRFVNWTLARQRGKPA
ncbi:MAG: 4Fe-4S binding protein [Candidatus Aminicenantes bacterium]|nr:4Fe-4S binding protein [Candidatus Aminicenantes bacterium]